eukprot:1175419-Prorocentrum_minimum.AAC.1
MHGVLYAVWVAVARPVLPRAFVPETGAAARLTLVRVTWFSETAVCILCREVWTPLGAANTFFHRRLRAPCFTTVTFPLLYTRRESRCRRKLAVDAALCYTHCYTSRPTSRMRVLVWGYRYEVSGCPLLDPLTLCSS